MKLFFHRKQHNDNGLLENILSGFNESDITELLKILYDAADIIHDKRLPEADSELKECFMNIEYKKRLFTEPWNSKQLKFKALLSLWQCAEKQREKLSSSTDWLLFHLTRGNICIRLSQYFYDQYDFKESEAWGNRAIEIIWHGINNGDISKENDVYLRLLQLLLSIYYIDYSRRNRRSSYTSAKIELNKIIQEIEKIDMASIASSEVQRQYALIYIEARSYLISIIRRRYHITDARKLSQEFHEQLTEKTLPFVNYLDSYDVNICSILAKLDLARIYRDIHDPTLYETAIQLALEANALSQGLDYTTNIDAVIIISSILRKSFKYPPDPDKHFEEHNICTSPKEINLLKKRYEIETQEAIKKRILEAINPGLFVEDHISLFKKLADLADKGYSHAKAELIKWYCMSLHKGFIQEVKDELPTDIKKYIPEEDNKADIRLRLLKGSMFLNLNQYTQARDLFLDLLKNNEETDYIRLGTVGLKARYLLANAYISLGQYSKAKSRLQEIHETLENVRKSRAEYYNTKESDASPDLRTIIDLIYCYMKQGNYDGAYQLYCDYLSPSSNAHSNAHSKSDSGNGGSIGDVFNGSNTSDNSKGTNTGSASTDIIEIDHRFLDNVTKFRRIAGLNNLISCCLFSVEPSDKSKAINRLKTAVNAFTYLKARYPENFNENPETSLLYGYFILLTGKEPTCDINWDQWDSPGKPKNLNIAHKFFKKACGYYYGFSPSYIWELCDKQVDKAFFSNRVLYVSAYVISLVGLYKEAQEEKSKTNGDNGYNEAMKASQQLERFILGLPKKYEISINAAIALAEWLLDYETDKENKKQLLRSFCFVTIYEDRGARAFNQLRTNRTFRLIASEQRGEVLVHLLCMYKNIKVLKEECTYTALSTTPDENKKPKQHLVHYTTIETLKKLLQYENCTDERATDESRAKNGSEKNCDGSNTGKQYNEVSKFRLSNCSHMNDVFEGREFLKCMAKVAAEQIADKKRTFSIQSFIQSFFEKYFPHLERSEKDMQPSSSHVYIGSLSVKNDSFPLWCIYSNNETGCNIEFNEDFFDINGGAYTHSVLREYIPFRYTDEDYPLYVVQYIGSDFGKEKTGTQTEEKKKYRYRQECKTEAIHYSYLHELLSKLFNKWEELDQCLDNVPSNVQLMLRQFVADRLNEVRFLFKSSDYEFEGEVRVVHASAKHEVNYDTDIPKVYVDVERKIKDLTVRLGSKVDDATVDQLVTWLKHTKSVKRVELAERNRYTNKSQLNFKQNVSKQ